MIVVILVVLAVGSLLLAERLADTYDTTPGPFAATFGLGTVLLTLISYLACLVVFLGFSDSRKRRIFSLLAFVACAVFLPLPIPSDLGVNRLEKHQDRL